MLLEEIAHLSGFSSRPGGYQRDLLCAFDRLPMAGPAKGLAPEEHRAFLFDAVELGRSAGA